MECIFRVAKTSKAQHFAVSTSARFRRQGSFRDHVNHQGRVRPTDDAFGQILRRAAFRLHQDLDQAALWQHSVSRGH